MKKRTHLGHLPLRSGVGDGGGRSDSRRVVSRACSYLPCRPCCPFPCPLLLVRVVAVMAVCRRGSCKGSLIISYYLVKAKKKVKNIPITTYGSRHICLSYLALATKEKHWDVSTRPKFVVQVLVFAGALSLNKILADSESSYKSYK